MERRRLIAHCQKACLNGAGMGLVGGLAMLGRGDVKGSLKNVCIRFSGCLCGFGQSVRQPENIGAMGGVWSGGGALPKRVELQSVGLRRGSARGSRLRAVVC